MNIWSTYSHCWVSNRQIFNTECLICYSWLRVLQLKWGNNKCLWLERKKYWSTSKVIQTSDWKRIITYFWAFLMSYSARMTMKQPCNVVGKRWAYINDEDYEVKLNTLTHFNKKDWTRLQRLTCLYLCFNTLHVQHMKYCHIYFMYNTWNIVTSPANKQSSLQRTNFQGTWNEEQMALRTHEPHKGGHSRSCGTTNCP